MGFLDKMKAANGLNFGNVESPDFPGCIIIMKSNQLFIISSALNQNIGDYPIRNENVRIFKLIGCGGHWAKYYIEFNDGKNGIITQSVVTQAEKGSTSVTVSPIERFIKYKDPVPQMVSVPVNSATKTTHNVPNNVVHNEPSPKSKNTYGTTPKEDLTNFDDSLDSKQNVPAMDDNSESQNNTSSSNEPSNGIYIRPVPIKDGVVYWNNHVAGEIVVLENDKDGVLKGTKGSVVGVRRDMRIDVKFGDRILSVYNQEISIVK